MCPPGAYNDKDRHPNGDPESIWPLSEHALVHSPVAGHSLEAGFRGWSRYRALLRGADREDEHRSAGDRDALCGGSPRSPDRRPATAVGSLGLLPQAEEALAQVEEVTKSVFS